MKSKRIQNIRKEETVYTYKSYLGTIILIILSIMFLMPILIVFMNSFKSKLYISNSPFEFPYKESFVYLNNYVDGMVKTGFLQAFGWTLFITLSSVSVLILFTSMTAWYIVRVKNKFTKFLYFMFVFSMVVPFQMVMFTLTKIANVLYLDNPVGIVIIYLGFGAGLSVFMFCGFIKSIPFVLEEAAMIDGSSPIATFFLITLPILKPTAITVAILNAMWIWNDYLLPYLIIGTEYKTISVAIQYLRGGYGSIDIGAMMSMLVLAITPIIVFYLVCQKYIIKGVTAGAVKG